MKIAINTRFLLPDRLEGIGRVTHELVKRMVAQHPEDEFIFLFDRPWDEQFIYGKNVKPCSVFPPARHPLLWHWWFEYGIARVLRKEKVDIFLSPDNYLSLRTKVPTVMICHDLAHLHYPEQIPALVRRFYNRYVPRYLEHARKVIAVSNFTKQDIIKQYDITPDKVKVIHNACSAHFQPLDTAGIQAIRNQYADRQSYFFYLGAVHPRKNVARMITAFDRFKTQSGLPHRLLLGGRLAWQTKTVRAAYDRATYRSEIKFLGRIPEADLPLLMGAAEALVYVSLFEGFGLPVLESLHCGVPVISSNTSSLPEVTGAAGLLVDPLSIDAIAEAMLRMCQEPGLRTRLVAECQPQAERFSWDRSAAELYEVLREEGKKK